MRVLMVHNRYRLPGGEDASARLELELLREHGDEAELVEVENAEIDRGPIWRRVALAWRPTWSNEGARLIDSWLRRFRPEVVHFQNIFPLISPAAYEPCLRRKVPVIQHLRNFRFACPAATLFRSGQECRLCVGRSPLPAILHGCYHASRWQSAAVAAMVFVHGQRHTWRTRVAAFISPSAFVKDVLVGHGLPGDRTWVKPNAVRTQPPRDGPGEYALFLGRLTEEKGIRTLTRIWHEIPDLPLYVVGDGPILDSIREDCVGRGLPNVRFIRWLPPDGVVGMIANARCVVVPSLAPEPFGRVVLEAFAQGVPVVGSRTGAIPELIDHGRTGLLVEPADAAGWVRAIEHLARRPAAATAFGLAGRAVVAERFSWEANYRRLREIYETAIR